MSLKFGKSLSFQSHIKFSSDFFVESFFIYYIYKNFIIIIIMHCYFAAQKKFNIIHSNSFDLISYD